jgi:site-specific recombinase XerD
MKPGFASHYGHQLVQFLAYKHSLGLRYEEAQRTLQRFDRYVYRHQRHRKTRSPLDQLIAGWLAQGPSRHPVTVANYLGVVRQFCLFRRRYDPKGFVPDRTWAPQSTESRFVPHVFTAQEIRRLLHQVKRLSCPTLGYTSIRLLVWVLYCTGLRFGEVARLTRGDLDLKQRLFLIRESKGRTRLVPFGADLATAIKQYLKRRALTAGPANTPLLLSSRGRPLSRYTVSQTIRRLLRLAGLKPARERQGPRPYDLRHAFAAHRLSRWYRRGINVSLRLPWLSTYMGHRNILGTEKYLTTTPELMALAARRFAKHWGKGSR